jgi:hypothetical protein
MKISTSETKIIAFREKVTYESKAVLHNDILEPRDFVYLGCRAG